MPIGRRAPILLVLMIPAWASVWTRHRTFAHVVNILAAILLGLGMHTR